MFRKVTVIGVGLMGSSVGLALRDKQLANEVVGVARHHHSIAQALKMGAIHRGTHDLRKALTNADLVILATPVKTIIHHLSVIGKFLKRGCIVTDVGSTKASIVETAQKHLPPFVFFVGSHPLAGSEKSGAQYGRKDLFQNSICIVTPMEKTQKQAIDKVNELWTKLGTLVKFLSPEDHDKILAHLSHLPHLLAYGLMDMIPSDYLEYATPGLKDITRIASSEPRMWVDICQANSKSIIHSLDELVKILSLLRKYIVAKDEQNLIEHFRKSKIKRDGLH